MHIQNAVHHAGSSTPSQNLIPAGHAIQTADVGGRRGRGRPVSSNFTEWTPQAETKRRGPGRPRKYLEALQEGAAPVRQHASIPAAKPAWQMAVPAKKPRISEGEMLGLLGGFLARQSRVFQRAARRAWRRQDLGLAHSHTLAGSMLADTSERLKRTV